MGFYIKDGLWRICMDFDNTCAINPVAGDLTHPVLRSEVLKFVEKVNKFFNNKTVWITYSSRCGTELAQYITKAYDTFMKGKTYKAQTKRSLLELRDSALEPRTGKPIADFYVDDMGVGMGVMDVPESPYPVVDFDTVYWDMVTRYRHYPVTG